MMDSSKQIRIGALVSYISIFFNMVSGLLYTPWMINQIGQSQYALFTLANSLITLFMVDFGLSAAATRFVSKYRAEGNHDMVNNFLGAIYKLYLVIDAVIFIALFIVYFFIDVIYVKLTPAELSQFKVVYVIAASYSIFHFPFVTFNGILNAYEQFVPLKLADLCHRILQITFTVVALLSGMGLYALVTVQALVGVITIVIKFFIIKKKTPVKVNFKYKDPTLYKSIFGFSIWVTVSSLAQRLIFNITPSVLGMVYNSAAIAVFGIVTTVEGYTYTFANAINGMFMPRISKIYTQDDAQEKLNNLALKVGRFQFVVNGLIVAGFVAVGQTFIHLWVGEKYADAYWGILLVIIPGLFYTSLQVGNTALSVTNRVKYSAAIATISGLVNVCLSFMLSRIWGAIGACLSIGIAYIVRDILLHILCKRTLELDVLRMVKECYLPMSIPLVVSIVGSVILKRLVPFLAILSWVSFLCAATITAVIYLVLAYCFGLTAAERDNIGRKVCIIGKSKFR